jgi:hypothetical protein
MTGTSDGFVERPQQTLIVTLTKEGNADSDRVVDDLKQRGFQWTKTMQFGAAKIVVGQKDGDYSTLEEVDGVDQIRVEGTKRTI